MSRPSLSLEKKFTDELLATCDETAKLGYVANKFATMLRDNGGVQTAEKLVAADIQSGLRRLRDLGRLDLATEAVMLRPEFRHTACHLCARTADQRVQDRIPTLALVQSFEPT